MRVAVRRAGLMHDTARAALGAFEVGDRALLESLGAESLEAMREMLRAKELRFFFARAEKRSLAARFLSDHRETARAVIARAEAACRHEFELLGAKCPRPGSFDRLAPGLYPRVPWNEDFGANRRWMKRYSALLPVQYGGDESDIKRVWELSRCQHFAALGEAYALTGDERFPREWAAQMTDWDRENPPLIGPNWISPMEAAIRIVNWIWGYAFMGDSPAFTDEARKLFCRNVLSHGRFILRHVEPYGNHRFSNLAGLVWLGVLFPEFKEARGWREAGVKGFCEELARQVRSDGVHFEGSIPYHRLVLEMAAATWLLLRRNGIELSPASQDAIKRMFRFTSAYLQPNGFAPQIGDADDGRLQELTPLDKRDHSYLLSLAAVLTGEGGFKRTPHAHPEAFWLLGGEGLKEYESLTMNDSDSHQRGHEEYPGPQPGNSTESRCNRRLSASICGYNRSVAFPESGFYVLRSDRLHAFISCRRPDAQDVGAHSHNDHLSFTLTLDGVEFIVDGGTYTYTGNLKDRHIFRSTAAHNTVIVDGQEINPLQRSDPFRLKDRADCRVMEWRADEQETILSAHHDGYSSLGVSVARRFRLDRREETLTIRDMVNGAGPHKVEWYLHFAPEVKVELQGTELLAQRDGSSLHVRLPPLPDASFKLAAGWYSPSYGVRQKTVAARGVLDAKLPVELEFAFEAARAAARSERSLDRAAAQ